MARFQRKLGQHKLRFQFDLEVQEIQIKVPYEALIQVVWKKGKSLLLTLGRLETHRDEVDADGFSQHDISQIRRDNIVDRLNL